MKEFFYSKNKEQLRLMHTSIINTMISRLLLSFFNSLFFNYKRFQQVIKNIILIIKNVALKNLHDLNTS